MSAPAMIRQYGHPVCIQQVTEDVAITISVPLSEGSVSLVPPNMILLQ
jgi:hypothetical protein